MQEAQVRSLVRQGTRFPMPQTNSLHAATKNNNNKKTGLENVFSAAAAAKSLQSCPTLCDPIDGWRQKNNLKNVNLLIVSALGNTVGLCDPIGFL